MTNRDIPADLSVFLPENLPTPSVVQMEFDYLYARSFEPEPLRTIGSFGAVSGQLMPTYDDEGLSLEDSLHIKAGNCLTRVAITAAMSRAVGNIDHMPRIISFPKMKSLHATTLVTIGKEIIECDNWTGTKPLNPENAHSGQNNFDAYLLDNPEVLASEGIVQLRQDFDGGVRLHGGSKSRELIDQTVRCIDTIFVGIDGLKSYLYVVEAISARAQNRQSNTVRGQLIPRL